jgi:hypothetical protein
VAELTWIARLFSRRAKQGETYTSNGICQDGKSLAICAQQDSESAESLSASLRFAVRASRKPGEAIRGLPSNARVRPKDGF